MLCSAPLLPTSAMMAVAAPWERALLRRRDKATKDQLSSLGFAASGSGTEAFDDGHPAAACGAEGKTGFFSWYHQQCMVPTSGSIKRTRRVYHNRRKTAWTDYEEDAPSTIAELRQEEKKPAEPERDSILVALLKIGGSLTREAVRAAAFEEADIGGGMVAALQRPGPCGWSPLLIAVQRKQAAAVSALLELGAEVECREPCCGWTPLMYAASSGKVDIVQQLLAHGANVNAVAVKQRWTPLCSAIQSFNQEVVHLLVGAGADVQVIKKAHPAIADIYMQEMR